MRKVVLLRHGESAWNKENRFTGSGGGEKGRGCRGGTVKGKSMTKTGKKKLYFYICNDFNAYER